MTHILQIANVRLIITSGTEILHMFVDLLLNQRCEGKSSNPVKNSHFQ